MLFLCTLLSRGKAKRASLTSTVSMLPLAVAEIIPLPGWYLGVAWPIAFKRHCVCLEEPSVRGGQRWEVGNLCLRRQEEQERVPERPMPIGEGRMMRPRDWLWGTF